MNEQKKTGTTKEIRDKLLSAVNACEEIVNDSDQTTGQRIQAVHALNTVAKTYLEVAKKARTEELLPDGI